MTDQVILPSRAGCSMDATCDVFFTPPAHPVVASEHTVNTHSFLTDPYVVDTGVPRDQPSTGIYARSLLGVGTVTYSDQPPDPLLVNTGAQVRWLATENTYSDQSGRWVPFTGDASLSWVSGPAAQPELDLDYAYLRKGAVVRRSALVFGGASYMALAAQGLTTNAFSIGIVAVLQPGFGASYPIIASSNQSVSTIENVDDNGDAVQTTPVGLTYSHGQLGVIAGGQVVSYSMRASSQTPVVILVSLQRDAGRLAVFDGGRSSRTFSLQNVDPFDIGIYLGRDSLAFDRTSTAVMDVLEVDLFDTALDESATEAYLNLMAATHGVV